MYTPVYPCRPNLFSSKATPVAHTHDRSDCKEYTFQQYTDDLIFLTHRSLFIPNELVPRSQIAGKTRMKVGKKIKRRANITPPTSIKFAFGCSIKTCSALQLNFKRTSTVLRDPTVGYL